MVRLMSLSHALPMSWRSVALTTLSSLAILMMARSASSRRSLATRQTCESLNSAPLLPCSAFGTRRREACSARQGIGCGRRRRWRCVVFRPAWSSHWWNLGIRETFLCYGCFIVLL